MNARTNMNPRTIIGADTQTAPGTAMAPKGAAGPLVPPQRSWLDRIPEYVSLPSHEDMIWSAVGGIAGALLWKRHRVLGAGLGLFVGRELRLIKENGWNPRFSNLTNLAVPVAGVGGVLALQKYAPSVARKAYGAPSAVAAVAGMVAVGAGMRAAGMR